MFPALYEHYPTKWAELFCPPKLEEFWKGVESKKDDRLKGHPLKKGRIGEPRPYPSLSMGMVLNL